VVIETPFMRSIVSCRPDTIGEDEEVLHWGRDRVQPCVALMRRALPFYRGFESLCSMRQMGSRPSNSGIPKALLPRNSSVSSLSKGW
jgi:hypothetical protein